MKIIGFNIKKLSIEQTSTSQAELKVQSKLDINDIILDEISLSKEPILKFEFAYEVVYDPKIAKIEIKGAVLVLDEGDAAKDIVKKWKDKKVFDNEAKVPLFNFILNKCSIKALALEDEFGLPLHIPLPKISKEQPKQPETKAKYTG